MRYRLNVSRTNFPRLMVMCAVPVVFLGYGLLETARALDRLYGRD